MIGRLHQLHVEYAAAQDRLLLKVNTADRKELRFWLTRAIVKSFWDSLQSLLVSIGRAGEHSDPSLKKAMVGFDQAKAASDKNFGTGFVGDPSGFPLGKKPLLVIGFSFKAPEPVTGMWRIALETDAGHKVGLPADAALLHSLSRMLIGITERNGWDLKLRAGYALDDEDTAHARTH